MPDISFAVEIDVNHTRRQILEEIAKHLNIGLRNVKNILIDRFETEISNVIDKHPITRDLINGQLQGELGIIDPGNAVIEIVHAIQENIRPEIIPCRVYGEEIRGGIKIYLYSSDIQDTLFKLHSSSFVSHSKSGVAYKIDWLNWLLTEGNEIIVVDYHFVSAVGREKVALISRTGKGIMGRHGSWQVPASAAGTVDDNWLTKAIGNLQKDLDTIFSEELSKVL